MLSAVRSAGSVIAFVAIYYLLPPDTSSAWAAITTLAGGLVVLITLIVFQVRWIVTSRYPTLRAVEALAFSLPLFLVLFAGSYVVMSHMSSGSFGQPLTHTDSLYFTVAVFSTVGFGDITAKSEAARLLVTAQMILDIAIIGLAIRAIVGAARHEVQRRSAKPLPAAALMMPAAV
jgi:voltage-gated potassium channel